SKLPDPILSVDSRGMIDIANDAAQQVLSDNRTELVGTLIGQWLSGFAVQRWLEKQPTEPTVQQIRAGGAKYFADLLPIWVADDAGKNGFAGAAITCKPQPLVEQWQRGGNHYVFKQILGEHSSMKRL